MLHYDLCRCFTVLVFTCLRLGYHAHVGFVNTTAQGENGMTNM